MPVCKTNGRTVPILKAGCEPDDILRQAQALFKRRLVCDEASLCLALESLIVPGKPRLEQFSRR